MSLAVDNLALSGPASTDASGPAADPRAKNAEDAAKAFEGLLIQQLFKVLRKTAPSGGMLAGGGGFAGDMYMQMFDQAMAEELSKGPGLGVAPMLKRSLGGDAGSTDAGRTTEWKTRHVTHSPYAFKPASSHHVGTPAKGATRRLQQAAQTLLTDGGAERFARDGRLDGRDLSSAFSTQEAGGVARFNVHDARGYQGYYKCNLLAFEVARRAGFQVPVVGRPRGWGYPVPNGVTADAGDQQLEGRWAKVATGTSAAELDGAIRQGSRGYMLTGSATGARAGHMAVVERVHEVHYDGEGRVKRIVFDGWEARTQGAQHLSRRTWNRIGNPGGNLARNGFDQIEILELVDPKGRGSAEVPLSSRAGHSNLDGDR